MSAPTITPASATSAPLPVEHCPRHRQYFLASCDGCRDAMSVRIERIRAAR